MAARKAASVFPEPVGAAITTLRRALINGHASACAGVGAAKVSSNQAATAGKNKDSERISNLNERRRAPLNSNRADRYGAYRGRDQRRRPKDGSGRQDGNHSASS